MPVGENYPALLDNLFINISYKTLDLIYIIVF